MAPANSASEQEIPLWSEPALQQLRALQAQSPAVVEEIVELFKGDSLRLVTELRAAVEAKEGETVSRLGHELLGASGTVGAERMATLAERLKDAFKAGDIATATARLTQLEQALEVTHRDFAQALREPPA